MMFPSTFKQDVAIIWDPLSKNLNDTLCVIERYSSSGLQISYMQMLGYGIFFIVLQESDTALIVFYKGGKPLANAEEMTDHMLESRDRIYEIMQVKK